MNLSIPPQHQSILNQLAQKGAIDIGKLQDVQRIYQEEDRVYHRPQETVYETVRTTIEIYHFR